MTGSAKFKNRVYFERSDGVSLYNKAATILLL